MAWPACTCSCSLSRSSSTVLALISCLSAYEGEVAGPAQDRVGHHHPAASPWSASIVVLRRRPAVAGDPGQGGRLAPGRRVPGGRAAAPARPGRRPRLPEAASTRRPAGPTRSCSAGGRRTSSRREDELRKKEDTAPVGWLIGRSSSRLRRHEEIDAGRHGRSRPSLVAATAGLTRLLAAPRGRRTAPAPPRSRPGGAGDRTARSGTWSYPTARARCRRTAPNAAAVFVCGTSKDDIDQRVAAYPTDLRVATLSLWAPVPDQRVPHAAGRGQQRQAARHHHQDPSRAVPRARRGRPARRTGTPAGSTPHRRQHRLRRAAGRAHLRPAGRLPDDAERWSPSSARPTCRSRASGPSRRTWSSTPRSGKPYGVRVDRSPGTYLRNFTVQHATAQRRLRARVRRVRARRRDRPVERRVRPADARGRPRPDHRVRRLRQRHRRPLGRRARPTSTSPTSTRIDRYPIEVRHCDSHDNLIGFAGQRGRLGLGARQRSSPATRSASPPTALGHGCPACRRTTPCSSTTRSASTTGTTTTTSATAPAPSRRAAARVRHRAWSARPAGLPPGTGVLNLGGNYDIWRDNWVYGNSYAGFVLAWVPGVLPRRRPRDRPVRHVPPQPGVRQPAGRTARTATARRNGMDYWWDGQGVGLLLAGDRRPARCRGCCRACGADDLPTGTRRPRGTCPSPARRSPCTCAPATTWPAQRIPSDCSWYGATGLDRIEVKVALGGAIAARPGPADRLVAAGLRGSRVAFAGDDADAGRPGRRGLRHAAADLGR